MPLDQLDDEPKHEMSFFDHVEEMRSHILRAVLAIVICTVIVFANKTLVFDTIIFGPKNANFITYKIFCAISQKLIEKGIPFNLCIENISYTLKNIDMSGQFMSHIKISVILGFCMAFPYIFWEIWKFIAPALHENEVKNFRGAVVFSSLLFFTGIAFGYFLLAPFSLNFLGSYTVSESVANEINLDSYIGLLSMMVLASGIIFELPVVVFLLAKLGLITDTFMRKYRRYAYVIILIIAAILTPSPDIMSQLILGIPLLILYEGSIILAKNVQPKSI